MFNDSLGNRWPFLLRFAREIVGRISIDPPKRSPVIYRWLLRSYTAGRFFTDSPEKSAGRFFTDSPEKSDA